MKKKSKSKPSTTSSIKDNINKSFKGDFYYGVKQIRDHKRGKTFVKEHYRVIKISVSTVISIIGSFLLYQQVRKISKDNKELQKLNRKILRKLGEATKNHVKDIAKSKATVKKIIRSKPFKDYVKVAHDIHEIRTSSNPITAPIPVSTIFSNGVTTDVRAMKLVQQLYK
jgi:hypothetical protein